MKRKFALLILVILAISLTLAACGQTAQTPIRTRWEEESHVFNITLADFSPNTNNFNTYNANGIADYEGTYYKDIAFTGEFTNWDELRPIDVKGTYTISIKPSDDGSAYCDVATTQEMCVEYMLQSNYQTGVDLTNNSELQAAIATQEQLDKYGLERHGDSVILWTSTETKVRFENNTTQKPLSSHVKVNGFYVGKVAQQLSKYEIDTVYDYSDEKRPVAKITQDGETSEYKFAKNSAGSFIDSNQIIMYLRSLDKASTSFQDSPSKSVFNPYTQTLQTANFGMSYEYNVILTRDNSTLATNLNVVSVTVGGSAFMMQENLPDTLALGDEKLDSHSGLLDIESMFTTVRFRVGYFAYEIDYANPANTVKGESKNWDKIWTALATPKAA